MQTLTPIDEWTVLDSYMYALFFFRKSSHIFTGVIRFPFNFTKLNPHFNWISSENVWKLFCCSIILSVWRFYFVILFFRNRIISFMSILILSNCCSLFWNDWKYVFVERHVNRITSVHHFIECFPFNLFSSMEFIIFFSLSYFFLFSFFF